jgi:hypothetical protein
VTPTSLALSVTHLAAGLGKVLANIRACMFAGWTFMLAIPLFIVMMTMALPVLALDKFRCAAQLLCCIKHICLVGWRQPPPPPQQQQHDDQGSGRAGTRQVEVRSTCGLFSTAHMYLIVWRQQQQQQ